MPFENQSINESVTPQPQKGNKLIIILIVLIILSGSYLAYSFYNQNDSDNTNDNANTEVLGEVNVDINSNDINDTESSFIPQDTEQPLDTAIDSSNNQIYTLSQIAENSNKSSCWTTIDGNVYNITSYIPNHPGGEAEILQICGKNGTSLFSRVGEHSSSSAKSALNSLLIGELAE